MTFRKIAHAIPEALGNKSLVSEYECDDCNHLFGIGIEDQLGRWSKPFRTFNGIRGKNGVPTIKRSGEGSWRIQAVENDIKVHVLAEAPIFTVNEVARTIDFCFTREVYTPVAVLKAFVRIGLTLMPHDEMENFRWALSWIKDTNHSNSMLESCIVFYSFTPGPRLRDRLVGFLLQRKEDVNDVPYANLILSYGNQTFQVALPSERDDVINGRSLEMPNWPIPAFDEHKHGKPETKLLNLTGRTPVFGEIVNLSFKYEFEGKS